MEYQTKDLVSYRLHMIKTDKFKSVLIKVILRKPVKKEDITACNILMDMLVNSTNTYKSKKELIRKTQDLYAATIYGNSYRYGLFQNLAFNLKILNEKYTEKGMLKESILFLKDILFNPRVENNAFNKEVFAYVKNYAKLTIESIKEDPSKYSIIRLLENMVKESPSSYHGYGYMKDLENLTEENMWTFYKDIIRTSDVDIYVIGNIDFDETYETFKENFIFDTLKKPKGSPIITWKKPSLKIKEFKEKDDFKQSHLAIGCKLIDLTNEEWKYALTIYNLILGGGSESKLFNEVREKNSLCYSIYSSVNKVENMMIIRSSMSKENIDKAIELIKNEMKKMIKGDFSEEDIDKAKEDVKNAIKTSLDVEEQIIAMYDSMELLHTDDFETRIKKMNEVTKEDIIKVAKKIKIDTIYCLEGEINDEKN